MPDNTSESLDQGHNPDCPWCGGDGHVDPGDLYDPAIDGRGIDFCEWRPCPYCQADLYSIEDIADDAPPYADDDRDGFLDGVEIVKAKYINRAGVLAPADVIAIVIHRLHRGRHAAGPRYVRTVPQEPRKSDGKLVNRYVSWHATIHAPGWKRLSTQHERYTRKAWHAGSWNQKDAVHVGNSNSLGIEHDYTDGQWPQTMIDESLRVIESYQAVCPNLTMLVAHAKLSKNRSDPGRGFPWGKYAGLGLELIH